MTEPEAHFIEQLALRLSEGGMQRMPARVFAALLIAPDGGLTAADIAERLQISSGAVSGATRYLTQTGLAERRRVPGERSDRFDVRGTTWAEATFVQTDLVQQLADTLTMGIEATSDPAARDRLVGTRDFFAYLVDELPRLAERWRETRDTSA